MKKKATPAADARCRCAIYTRKSTTHGLDQEFNSLDAQRESCAAYIKRQPNWTLVDEHYDDGGFTGANIERPAFQRLMADVEAGKLDVVVVYKVDRLSRSLLDFAKVMERLDKAHASFVSVTQNFSTADAMGRLTMNLLASFAEFEREMISERTRDKIAATRRKGLWTGGPRPLGYRVENKRLFIDDVEAPVVREAFELFLAHGRMSTVATLMNERGRFPKRSKRNDKQPKWSKDTMAKLLRNPIYGGVIAYFDERHAGEHEPIIDKVTFERAQHLLKSRSRNLKFHGLNFDYVLRGLLKCGKCRRPMIPASSRKGRQLYRYYKCSNRDKHGRDECNASPLAAGAIETYVIERIAEAVDSKNLRREIEQAMMKRLKAKEAEFATVKSRAPQLIAMHSARASKLVDELTQLEGRAHDIAAENLNATTDELAAAERSLADAERGEREVRAAMEEFGPILDSLKNFLEVWAVMTPANRVRFMGALIEEVVVDDKKGEVSISMVDFESVVAA